MSKGMMKVKGVQLFRSALERIVAHAEETYPQECFGFLLGHFSESRICVARPGRNVNTSRPHDRYEMDPQDFLQAQAEAEKWGGEIMGFYHSHPDGTAIPSAYDRKRAWEEYLYLIIPVSNGRAEEARLWRVKSPEGPFVEVPWHIIERREVNGCSRAHPGSTAH